MYVVSLISCAQCVVVHTGLYWYRDCEWVAIECGKYFWDTLLGIKKPKIMQKCQIICNNLIHIDSKITMGPGPLPFCVCWELSFFPLRSLEIYF